MVSGEVVSQYTEDGIRKRKALKNRWGEYVQYTLPSSLPQAVEQAGLQSYMLHLRIVEVNKRLRGGNLVPPAHLRSPSPEPIYDASGKRLNVRETRYRMKLENEKARLIDEALKLNPAFRAPTDYKMGRKYSEKVYLPAGDYPELNFIGLLIGPRGNTLKKMESETGAKISIRGKGSLKEGKYRPETDVAAQDEELHCLVSGDTPDSVSKAVKIINKIIETAVSCPETENELKKIQLRELAALNGTLRDEDAAICTNCGGVGHKKFECLEQKNFTTALICQICGNTGHMTRDCMHRNNPEMLQESKRRMDAMNSEYMNFMSELQRPSDYQEQQVQSGNAEIFAASAPETQIAPPGQNQAPWNMPPVPTGSAGLMSNVSLKNAPWKNGTVAE